MEKLDYTVVKDPHPVLRQKSKEVPFPLSAEDEKIINFLHNYLVITSDDKVAEEMGVKPGVGLACNQLGIAKRMLAIYIEYRDEEGNVAQVTQFSFINPKIISKSVRPAYLKGGEGCLSVEGDHPGYVVRSSFITVQGYDYLTKTTVQVKFRGYEAIVIQHELDHLDGILFYDRINKKDPWLDIEGAQVI
ncbi:MAG: peptide deformylase [Bacilli bacterium]|nr:peptide deformylase [Bacilli bacterium]